MAQSAHSLVLGIWHKTNKENVSLLVKQKNRIQIQPIRTDKHYALKPKRKTKNDKNFQLKKKKKEKKNGGPRGCPP